MRRVPTVLLTVLLLAVTALPLAAQGSREGITLHGHWVIEVRNPNASLAERREFDNSLTDSGKRLLATILAKGPLSRWAVMLMDSSNPSCAGPCIISAAGLSRPFACLIAEPALTVQLPRDPTTQTPLGTLQLSGSATVDNPAAASAFDQVQTVLHVDYPDGSGGMDAALTQHALTRVTVTPGQIVNVLVTFSFS